MKTYYFEITISTIEDDQRKYTFHYKDYVKIGPDTDNLLRTAKDLADGCFKKEFSQKWYAKDDYVVDFFWSCEVDW